MLEAPINEDLQIVLDRIPFGGSLNGKIINAWNSHDIEKCLCLMKQLRSIVLNQIHTDQRTLSDLDYMTNRIKKEEA